MVEMVVMSLYPSCLMFVAISMIWLLDIIRTSMFDSNYSVFPYRWSSTVDWVWMKFVEWGYC